jgi:hypothetical protein
MVVEGMQIVTTGLNTIHHLNDVLGVLNTHLHMDWLVLAQQVSDTNVLGKVQEAWNNFIQTGQVWALLIGIAIGYFFKGMTSY